MVLKSARCSRRCRTDGSWEAMQCLPEVGLCWCVNSIGEYMKGTAVRGTPRCASSRMGRKLDVGDLQESINTFSQNNGLGESRRQEWKPSF